MVVCNAGDCHSGFLSQRNIQSVARASGFLKRALRRQCVGVALPVLWATSRTPATNPHLSFRFLHQLWRKQMPIIAWLLGVPISVIILLMLFGVF
jgi:hypothetical protein